MSGGLVHQYLPFILTGIAAGSIYGIAGMGLVLSYKTSGLFNFGHGAVACAGAYVFYELWVRHGWPWPLAAAIAVLAFGGIAGLLMEALSRGLSGVSTTYRIVATVGILLAVRNLAVIRYGSQARPLEQFLPKNTFRVGGVYIGADQVVIAIIALVSAAALAALFRFTRLGASMRAVVDDPLLLDMTGSNPVRVRRLAWVISSCFASMSGVLLAPLVGLDSTVLTLVVVAAFAAAALGFFTDLWLTYAGGLIIGVLASISPKVVSDIGVTTLTGLPPSVPFLMLFIVLLVVPRRRLAEVGRPTAAPPARVQPPLAARASGLVLLVGVTLLAPTFVGARLPLWNQAAADVLLFLSLGLLVKTSGQVSLCHMGFAAVGAATFGNLSTHAGLPWAVALLGAGLLTVPIGALVAIPAIRLSGLYLALATLGFGILLNQMAYRTFLLFGGGTGVRTPRPGISSLSTDRGFYYVLVGVAALGCLVVSVVERSRLGRLLRAMADSPMALTTGGADVNITRVMVFCLSAFLAGISGALVGQTVGVTSGDTFPAINSLVLLAVLALQFAFTPFGTVGCAVLASASMILLPAYLPDWLGLRPDTVTNYLGLLFGVGALLAGLTTRPRRTGWLETAAARSVRRRRGPAAARTARAAAVIAADTRPALPATH